MLSAGTGIKSEMEVWRPVGHVLPNLVEKVTFSLSTALNFKLDPQIVQ
jgi:hypothetical protein